MPPTKEVKDTRRVKRVANAINNPTSTLSNLAEALAGVQHVRIYQDEIDAWVQAALKNSRYDMVLEIFNRKQVSLVKSESAVLRHFIIKQPRYLKNFVASNRFHPDWPYHLDALVKIKQEDIHLLANLFALPRTGKLLLACDFLFSRSFFKALVHKNPDIQERIQRHKNLMRFWLLVVKRNLPAWRDSLYYPGSGSLYLKAYASFKSDLPCLLTCV
jgi:hypothetical protein